MAIKFFVVMVMVTAWISVSTAAGQYDDDDLHHMEKYDKLGLPYHGKPTTVSTRPIPPSFGIKHFAASGNTITPMMSIYLAAGFALVIIVRKLM